MWMNNAFVLDTSLDVSFLGNVRDWVSFVDSLGAVDISVGGDWNQFLFSDSGDNWDLARSVNNAVMLLGNSDWSFDNILVV